MRRRVQFSLLGLLLLTAALAVGVKVWQGPHRVVVPIAQAPEAEYVMRAWGDIGPDVAVEYETVNTLDGPIRGAAKVRGGPFLVDLFKDEQNRFCAQPVNPIGMKSWMKKIGRAPESHGRVPVEIVLSAQHDSYEGYLITDRGAVYRFDEWRVYFMGGCEPVDPHEIADTKLRSAVFAELETLPTE